MVMVLYYISIRYYYKKDNNYTYLPFYDVYIYMSIFDSTSKPF